ncbi:capsular polysaccharide export protein, LipB/KpsS family [Vibrio hepatarius]|uniref:capsular polysaccharide export protein, LipB/KpsS family n=1 Tax=Vibrio hepatarius TaxID=171383 RepID=UPI00148CE682|nr:capsular biosynthesis protein [Vibrio hepatarius]NOI15148.1 capsular biosynthesis protein [Vibrio hepatarius]
MNILSLDSPYSPLFSMIVEQIEGVTSFHGLFSEKGYKHYFYGDRCVFVSDIVKQNVNITENDINLAKRSNNHYSAYIKKFEGRDLREDEINIFASFSNYFRTYLKDQKINFVMMHNDLRWHHALAREICIEEGVPFCVSELGLFRPYTTTLDYHGVNANSSITNLDVKFEKYLETHNDSFDVNKKFHGHESNKSKLNFAYFLMLNKIASIFGHDSPISHNDFKIRLYAKRFWLQSVKHHFYSLNKYDDTIPSKPYVFFPMQLEYDTQFLVHSDFSSNQVLLQQVEKAFYDSNLAKTHELVVKLHPNDLGVYNARNSTVFTKANATMLVNKASSVISVNSTVCMDALETDKPLYVLGRAFFARPDICQPCKISELADALSNPNPVDREARRGFIKYLKYEYSIHGAGFSFKKEQLIKVADEIKGLVSNNHQKYYLRDIYGE